MELRVVKYFNYLGRGGRIDYFTDFLSRVRYLFIFWAVVSALAVFFEKEKRHELLVALSVVTVVHFLVSEGFIKRTLTKLWGVRKRPYMVTGDILPIGRRFSDSSFPSSHMATTLAMLVPLTYFFPVVWPAALFFVLAMAFSRLHNGMHYPSDILAGIVLGSAYGALGVYLSDKLL